MIELRDVSYDYGSLRAVEDVSVSVRPGEFVSFVGPSGSGKTTLLKLIGGLLQPAHGTVGIDGEPPDQVRRDGRIGFVFQRPVLLPWRTALQNVELPLELLNGRASPDKTPREVLADVGLSDFVNALPRQLSGGMEQRVALARALVLNPSILLMDEPFSALDEISRERLDREVLRLTETLGRTVLFVTHSVTEAVLLSDRIVVLTDRPARIRSVITVDLERPRVVGHRSPRHLELIENVRRLLIP